MIVYKNENLIIAPIEENFFSVVNPSFRDGLKVINKSQYDVLMAIDNVKTVDQLAQEFGTDEESITNLCNMFLQKNMVNFDCDFEDPQWHTDIKSIDFWVHTTDQCNLRCSYCYIQTLGIQNNMDESTIKTFMTKIIETVKKRSLKSVSLRLAGGEPLLRFKVWRNYIATLRDALLEFDCKLKVTFLTNLVALTDEIIEFIKSEKIGIGVSLDGIGEYQDKTRHFPNGSGSFEIVSKNINKLLANGIRPGIMTVISNANVDNLVDFTKFLIEKNLGFRLSFVQGNDLDLQKLSIELKKCYELFSAEIDKGYAFTSKHSLCDLKFTNPYFQTCSCGLSSGSLYIDGGLYFCHQKFGVDQPTGTLLEEEDLVSIIQRKTYYGDVNDDCKKCSLKHVCTSGCPLDRVDNKDPHCEVFKEIVPIVYQLMAKEKLMKIKKVYENAV